MNGENVTRRSPGVRKISSDRLRSREDAVVDVEAAGGSAELLKLFMMLMPLNVLPLLVVPVELLLLLTLSLLLLIMRLLLLVMRLLLLLAVLARLLRLLVEL